MRKTLSLIPAKWIWYPSQRTLANTFVLFRREFELGELPRSARGWITAVSRYELYVNGTRVQWGPAPCDPRHEEADPADLLPYLKKGKNVLAVKVLFYGYPEGTWVAGNPGLLYRFDLELPGKTVLLCSGGSDLCAIDQSHRPGQFQRWYLRALQEETDNRKAEVGWAEEGFRPSVFWKNAMVVGADGSKPSIYNNYYEYLNGGIRPEHSDAKLYAREIPMPEETILPARALTESGSVIWNTSPDDWFLFRSPGAYSCVPDSRFFTARPDSVTYCAEAGISRYFTFAFAEQMVGFPQFTITAPEGTVIELMVQESHLPYGEQTLLDTTFHCWSRFICRKGENQFRCFDFESVKWVQLHITAAADGTIQFTYPQLLRRKYPFEAPFSVHVSDPAIQRLMDAGANTLYNAAIETLVDGMGRERQQYAGDCSHALGSLRALLGNTLISRRFLYTYADGMTPSGYFIDCYPAGDRLKRVAYKQIGLSYWGPIIDHSVGFVGDCHKYVLETGDTETVRDIYPKLKQFVDFLKQECGDGLFPVENTGAYCVWLDHHAFEQQRHRLCPMNIYIYGMLVYHWLPLLQALGREEEAAPYQTFARQLGERIIARFWDQETAMFWDNLPWLEEEGEPKVCDRTLAMALLYRLCPEGNTSACARYLAYDPALKLSYPCNAVWRQWALARQGYAQVILEDLRQKWANMPSVRYNNSYQEHWQAEPDSTSEWSHIPQAPLLALRDVWVGLRPLEPGYRRFAVCPQPADLGDFDAVLTTVSGNLHVSAARKGENRYEFRFGFPPEMEGILEAFPNTTVEGLSPLADREQAERHRYVLRSGQVVTLAYMER